MERNARLLYDKEATCFNEALPLGNGRIGAMVYGGIHEETISLNEDTLWSGYLKEQNIEDYPSVYQRAKEFFASGERAKAQECLEQGFGDYLVQMYLPVGDLKIKMDHQTGLKYSRSLQLDEAVCRVAYENAGNAYAREMLVSEPHQVLAVQLKSSHKQGLSFTVSLEGKLKCAYQSVKGAVLLTGKAPDCTPEYGNAKRTEEGLDYTKEAVSYACAFLVRTKGGSVRYEKESVKVEHAEEATVYLSIRTNFAGFDKVPKGDTYIQQCRKDIEEAAAVGYERLKEESITSHRILYDRCSISLGEDSYSEIPTDMRLKRMQDGEEDTGLYTLLFAMGKYLTVTGSRPGTQPLNLQGIWNDNTTPPWASNYTLNINTEMNYWPTLAFGLFECYEPFIRFVEELSVSGAETAKNYYGTEGWVCHHSSDIWRMTHPGTNRLPQSAQWGFWNMASGWLSVMLWEYYRYTKDVSYLERVYPIMEGAAAFYRSLLMETKEGLILPLSTSPENNYIEQGQTHAIDRSTAMTQEILYDLFGVVSLAAEVLGVSNEYGQLKKRLKRPFIQENKELCEWDKEHEVWDIHHRHISHLYGLFPSNQFAGQKEILSACKKVLESRGDGGTGWSLAWKINLWARLGDGEHALQLLKNQLRLVPANVTGHDVGGGSYPNLFCAHPPFQIDGNFGAASGILQMLVQCDEADNPILLPALPASWKKGMVENVYLPNKRKVSFAWEDGKIVWSKIDEVFDV